MVTTTQTTNKQSLNDIRNIAATKPVGDSSVVVPLSLFMWNEAPPQKGFHSVDSLLERLKEKGAHEYLKAAKDKLADIFSANGVTLRSLRLSKNLSQTDLAQMMGMNQYIISAYEHAKHDMTFSTMNNMAKALNVDLNTLGQAISNTKEENGK